MSTRYAEPLAFAFVIVTITYFSVVLAWPQPPCRQTLRLTAASLPRSD